MMRKPHASVCVVKKLSLLVGIMNVSILYKNMAILPNGQGFTPNFTLISRKSNIFVQKKTRKLWQKKG
jgi:hypothetical protein